MEINGVAHGDAHGQQFRGAIRFEKLLVYLGMKPVMRSEEMLYCVGGRTAVGIMRGDDSYRAEKFQQRRVGLHHVCLRARERGDVDEVYRFLKTIDAKIVHPPEDGPWAPGYYSVLFEDPDGIRLGGGSRARQRSAA